MGGGVTRGSTSVALNSSSTLAAGQTAGGYYSGVYRVTSGQSLGATGGVQFIITESGALAGVTSDGNNIFTATAVTPTTSLLYNATGSIISNDGNGSSSQLTVNGAASPRNLIAGLYAFTGETGQFYASYSASRYERASSLALTAGSWNIRKSDGTSIGTATISSSGAISGSAPGAAPGCTFSGTVATVNTSYNAYNVTLTPSGCGGTATQTGLGSLYDTNATNDSFQLILANAAGDSITASLTKF